MKKAIIPTLITSLLLSANLGFAANKGNWTERFNLTGGHWVEHTPKYVTLDGAFTAGKGLRFSAGSSINGMKISGCGLNLETESTRSEFVAALTCSGLYPTA